MPFVLALDEGTTSCRAVIFDELGQVRAMAQREFTRGGISTERRLAAIVSHFFCGTEDFVMPRFNDSRHDAVGSDLWCQFTR